MNCPKCNGTTKVVDRRGVRRRRACDTCNHRFSTIEMLADAVPKKAQEPVHVDITPTAKPAVKPRKKVDQEITMTLVQRNASARRKIEDLREAQCVRRQYDFADDYDFNELPDSW